jgi:hypothetical protein
MARNCCILHMLMEWMNEWTNEWMNEWMNISQCTTSHVLTTAGTGALLYYVGESNENLKYLLIY